MIRFSYKGHYVYIRDTTVTAANPAVHALFQFYKEPIPGAEIPNVEEEILRRIQAKYGDRIVVDLRPKKPEEKPGRVW